MTARWLPRIPSPFAAGLIPPPPDVNDKFAPRIIVGNVPAGDTNAFQAAPFQYIPDPGDGSGIAAALAAAVAGYDVYVRPGTYDFETGAVVTPLTIPTGVNLRGAPGGPDGLSGTILKARVGDANTTQDLFILGTAASLEDVQIRVPLGFNGGANGLAIIQIPNVAIRISRVYLDMTFGGNGQRNTDFAIWTGLASAPSTGDLIENVEVVMPTQASGVFAYIGILFGFIGVDSVVAGARGPTVRDCVVRGGQLAYGFININEPIVTDCVVDGLIISSAGAAGSAGIFYILETTAATTVTAPKITTPRITVATTGDAVGTSAMGISIANNIVGSVTLQGCVIDDYQIFFATGVGLVSSRHGIDIRIGEGGTGRIERGAIGEGVVLGAGIDILFSTRTNDNTAGTAGSINDWSVVGLVGPGFDTMGANIGEGAQLDIVHVAQPKINRVSFVGCNFVGAPAGTNGVLIGANVTRTIVSSCQLLPGAGNAFTDNGILSQTIGNIVV